jgi:hypothetical protein
MLRYVIWLGGPGFSPVATFHFKTALAAEVDLGYAIASGAKAQVFRQYNVTAEAVTHKDHLWNEFWWKK